MAIASGAKAEESTSGDGPGILRSSGAERGRLTRGRTVRMITQHQFVRYLLVGGWNTAFSYVTYAAFTWMLSRHLSHGYIYAAFCSLLVNITVAFLGYKWFVFRTAGNYFREWVRCLVVYGTAALPNLMLLPVIVNALVYLLHVPPGGKADHAAHFQLSAQYLSGTFLTAPYLGGAILTLTTVLMSFFGHKHFSFRPVK